MQAADEKVAAASADASDWQQALSKAEVRVHAAQQELHDRRAGQAEVHVQLQQMAAEVRGPCRVGPVADMPSITVGNGSYVQYFQGPALR